MAVRAIVGVAVGVVGTFVGSADAVRSTVGAAVVVAGTVGAGSDADGAAVPICVDAVAAVVAATADAVGEPLVGATPGPRAVVPHPARSSAIATRER